MEQENSHASAVSSVEPPRGFFGARVDEKGRLKLPSAIAQYLAALGEQKVFVTTLDGFLARIYTISGWQRAESMLEEAGEDVTDREDVATVAYHFGADSEIDPQGRVLVPTELRRALKLRERRRRAKRGTDEDEDRESRAHGPGG